VLADALEAGRFADARRLADARLKSQPRDARLWTIRAIALERLGRFPQSLASFERALTLDPDSLAALKGATEVAYRTHSPKATRFVQRVLAREPGDETAHAMAGALAAAAAGAGLALSPGDPELLNLFGAASAAAGQLEPAIAALRKATEVAPADERHYVDLAALCVEHDAFDLALEVVNAGLANIPGSSRLYTMRGAIRAERGEIDDAMRDFERASALGPDETYGSVGLSLVLRQVDRLPEAIALLRRKLARQPRDATLNYLLADVLPGT